MKASQSSAWPRITRRATIIALVMATLAVSATAFFSNHSIAFAQEPGAATYEQEIQTGRDLLKRRRFEDALKAFKRANDLKGKTSAEAFLLMANAYMGLDAYKNAVQSAERVVELAGNDNALQAEAYNLKGIAIQKQSDGKDVKKLQESEVALRQSIALKADFAEPHYNLGVVLMQQNRDAEGIAELKQFLQLSPNVFNSGDARKMIDNPRRAREPFAPDFSITTAEGEYISLDDLKGKVVLLDFWGTWCPPCVASVPGLRDLNKKYSKESSFVMISVSSDSDEETWKEFVGREKMVWAQFLDRERAVQRAFKVSAFPTYIVLDSDGVIRYRSTGMSLDKESELENAIRKQIKNLAKSAPSD
jgi:peroxiredoxin